jgi:alkaline phosphatase D
MKPQCSGRRRFSLAAGGAAAALVMPVFVPHARACVAPCFGLGVASGCPRPQQVVLWTRLTGPGLPERVPVQWELALDEAFSRIAAQGSEWAEAPWAHSVHAEPAGLEPGRWYWYRFTCLGQRSAAGRTRTAPAAGSQEGLQFAIASCQRWDHGHYAAWHHMAREGVDLVLFLGDYIYEYAAAGGRVRRHEGEGPARTLAQYRARHAQYKSDPALQAAHAAAPWVCVWDDHEVENDYAGSQAQDLAPGFAGRRAAAYQAYWEHLPFPAAARPSGPDMRIHDRYDWGQLARIHTLDDRQYRDPQACPRPGRGGGTTVRLQDCAALQDPRRSLLGPAQERWLAEGWSTTRLWNLLAQQTLMAPFSWRDPGAPDGPVVWTDGWDGYAPARQRLLDVLRERRVPGVVVLSGDVHGNYVANLHAQPSDPASPVLATEFCGTSISSEGLPQERITAALPWNPHLRYGRSDQRGYMRFSLDARQLQVQLRVLDDVRQPDSAIRTAARFVVEAASPGVQSP